MKGRNMLKYILKMTIIASFTAIPIRIFADETKRSSGFIPAEEKGALYLEKRGARILRGRMNVIDDPVQDVDLDGLVVTEEMVDKLPAFTEVQSLSLHGAKITDKMLKPIGSLKKLRLLDLASCKITDEGLKHLASLENVEELDLDDTLITDDGLKELTKMKELLSLNLGVTKITNRGLKHLDGLPKLEDLVLMFCLSRIWKNAPFGLA
jgi:Leucine-rich repeat (LRR) protein